MSEEKLRKGFEDDESFFKKTTGMTETGKLEKAIPTVENGVASAKVSKKKVPKSVTEYKKKIEGAFKTIDDAVEDLQEIKKKDSSWGKSRCAKMIHEYYEFKELFSDQVNSAINYPRSNDSSEVAKESSYDKSRIKI